MATAVLQEERTVSVAPDQAQLLAANGPPVQVEFTASAGKDFSKVDVIVGGLVGIVSTTEVYYAFADNSNGLSALCCPPCCPSSSPALGCAG